jgi:hypothetical protein
VEAKKGCVEKIPFPAPPNRGKVGGRLVSSIPMKTLNDLLPILQDAKRDLMAKYPITEMGVFGSYARGDADERSDLDILYVMDTHGFSLFDIVDIQLYLQNKTGIPTVDLVNKNRLKRFLAPRILQEAVYL